MTSATEKLAEGKEYICDLDERIAELSPSLEKSQADLMASELKVNAAKKDYQDSRIACENQQIEIDEMEGPYKQLKADSHEDLGQVNKSFCICLAQGLFSCCLGKEFQS